jgi:Xaa-Pro aminopeptidase
MWGTGHPVGYWAHDLGPALSGGQSDKPPGGDATRLLQPGMVFAWDGFFSWEMDDAVDAAGASGAATPAGEAPVMVGPNGKPTKTISVEEMAVVTETGAQLLSPPQESLILIGGAGK